VLIDDFFPRCMDWAEDHKKATTVSRNREFWEHLKPFAAGKLLTEVCIPLAEKYKKRGCKQTAPPRPEIGMVILSAIPLCFEGEPNG